MEARYSKSTFVRNHRTRGPGRNDCEWNKLNFNHSVQLSVPLTVHGHLWLILVHTKNAASTASVVYGLTARQHGGQATHQNELVKNSDYEGILQQSLVPRQMEACNTSGKKSHRRHDCE